MSFVTLNLTLWGQLAGIPPKGAVSLGLGGISSIDSKEWAVFNNPAGLASVKTISSVAGYQTILNFSPFNSVMVGFSTPYPIGTVAIGVSRFGDQLFNTQTVNLGFARKIGIMSIGLKTNILQVNIDGFGKRSVFVSEIGGLTDLAPTLTLGTHIYNFTQSLISPNTSEKIPTIVRLSLDYHPTDPLNVYAEIEKDVVLDPELRFGLSYCIVDSLTFRTGISTVIKSHSFGSRLTLKKFLVDYAIQVNHGISTLHSFGLTYQMNK